MTGDQTSWRTKDSDGNVTVSDAASGNRSGKSIHVGRFNYSAGTQKAWLHNESGTTSASDTFSYTGTMSSTVQHVFAQDTGGGGTGHFLGDLFSLIKIEATLSDTLIENTIIPALASRYDI